MTTQTMAATKIAFGSFTIERKYEHRPERVFRVGGHEHGKFRPVGAPITISNDRWYLEILKGQRIVNASMHIDGKLISRSPATTEFFPDGANGCRLVFTEQGAYFGGEDDIKNRKAGCEQLFGKLDDELKSHS